MAITPGHERALAPKPVSTSSLDTALSGHNDGETENNSWQRIITQQSLDAATPAIETSRLYNTAQNMQQPYPASITSGKLTSAPDAAVSHNQVHISPSTGVVVPPIIPNSSTVPEFLYQLTKMLTDNNRDIIEWSNGKIEVHKPHKLQTHVLSRYFRHSKFASFQRQLNYFGFRKLAGKGKMAPCSYVNDATTKDLGSLLMIKRKVGNEPKAKTSKRRDHEDSSQRHGLGVVAQKPPVNPVLANILYRSTSENQLTSKTPVNPRNEHIAPNQSQQEIARIAVGRGIRHSFSHPNSINPAPLPPRHLPPSQGPTTAPHVSEPNDSTPVVEASLSALKNNFQISLGAANGDNSINSGDNTGILPPATGYQPGSMHRDDSLVDLAMIPFEDDGDQSEYFASSGLTFIDFPWQDPNVPSNST